MRYSLRTRLILTFIGLTIVPLFLVGGVLIQQSFATETEQALTLQSHVAQAAASKVAAFIQGRENELRLLTGVRGVSRLEEVEQIRLLDGLLTSQGEYEELTLLDGQGQELISRLRLGTVDQLSNRASLPEYERPKATGEVYYSPIEIDEFGEPFMTIALPLADLRSGTVSHVLLAKFRFKTIWELMIETSTAEQTVYVVDTTGQVVAHPNPSVVLQGRQFALPDEDSFTTGLTGVTVALAGDRIALGEETLTVVAEQPRSVALDLAFNIIWLTGGAILIGLIIAIVLGALAAQRIVQPIAQLATTAQAISSGDFSLRAKVSQRDEIGDLATAFNEMTGQLSGLIENLETHVADRTRDLQVASQVAREVSTILDLAELLPNLVDLTRTNFDLYAVSVFLYEEETRTLHQAAGIHEDGNLLTDIQLDFHLEARPSLIAKAARERQTVIINDVAASSEFLAGPVFPLTKAEAVLPMMVGDNLIGVLDLKAKSVDHFSLDEQDVFITMAEQIGIAVQNARLYAAQVNLAEELRNVDQMKSQFLASMSHELRTPLNAILNFTEMTAAGVLGPVNEEQEDVLMQVVDSGQHLLSLINDVLDITKIQSGKMTLFVEDNIDLYDELKAVTATAEALTQDKPVDFIADIDPDLPFLSGDRRRIRQILLNIVSNAAKFTEEGSITLGVKKRADEILFAVIDTGPGIPPAEQTLVFEPFQQTESGVQHAGGTGLGMPISKSLAEAHGGQMWLESEPGEGAAFYVTLPVQSTPEPAKEAAHV